MDASWDNLEVSEPPPQHDADHERDRVLSELFETPREAAEYLARKHGLSGTETSPADALRVALRHIMWPDRGTTTAQAAWVIAYAIGLPGLPPLEVAAASLGLRSRQTLSARIITMREKLCLPPNLYGRTDEVRQRHQTTNRRRTARNA